MKVLYALSAIFSWICLQAARLAGLLLFVLASVIIYDVVGRKFFDTGSFKLQELEWHLHGAIAMLVFGYAYTRNAHVRIDIFAKAMSMRLKIWLELFGILFFLIPFMLILIDFGYDYAEKAWVRNETSPGGRGLSDRWLIKSVIPLAGVLTILGALSVALRCVVALVDPRREEDIYEDAPLWRMRSPSRDAAAERQE